MPTYSARSCANLAEAHPALQAVFREVIEVIDHTVIEGYRGRVEQDAAYHAGKSKLPYPQSKHNRTPAWAVDACPYPIDWNDRARFFFLAGAVFQAAYKLGVKMRWGGDWDGDGAWRDQTFHDLPHFELVDPGPYGTNVAAGEAA